MKDIRLNHYNLVQTLVHDYLENYYFRSSLILICILFYLNFFFFIFHVPISCLFNQLFNHSTNVIGQEGGQLQTEGDGQTEG